MEKFTVICIHEPTGKVAMQWRTAKTAYDAMFQTRASISDADDTIIVCAVSGHVGLYPPCKETGSIVYACDLVTDNMV
jgi:hypothetical protein